MSRAKRIFLVLLPIFCLHSARAATFTTEQWQTPNGVQVVFYQAKEVPILDVSLAFAAGSAYDEGHFGLSNLTTQLLNQGNKGLDAKSVALQIEKTGAQFAAQTTRDMVTLTLRTLTKPEALASAIQAFASIAAHPDFPESEFHHAKKQQLMAIKQIEESPDEVANQVFFQALYQDHPYAHPVIGDTKHVERLDLQQVRDFYQQHFVGRNAVLVLVGAIDSENAHRIADSITHDLAKGQPVAPLAKAKPLTKAVVIAKNFPSSQTVLRLGQLGIDYHDPRYFPLLVGNTILGGPSMVSLLALELREKRGLTYGAYSQYSAMPGIGPFVIGLSTRNATAQQAAKLTEDTLTHFVETGPTDEQLKATKQFLTGSFPMSLASNRSIADLLLRIAFYHLPKDYLDTYLQHVNAVTVAEIKHAFASQINAKALLQVRVGKV